MPLGDRGAVGEGQLFHLFAGELPLLVRVVAGLELAHDLAEDFPRHAERHAPGLEEPPVVVPGKPDLAGRSGHALHDLLVDPHVEEGGHHSRHGDGGPAAHRQELGAPGAAELVSGHLFDLLDARADLPFEMVPGMLIPVDDPLAAEDLGGDDKPRGDAGPLGGQDHQVVSFPPQVDQVVGQGIGVMDEAGDLLGVVGHQQVQVRFAQGLPLLGEDLMDAGQEIIQILEPEGGGDQVPEKSLADLVDELVGAQLFARRGEDIWPGCSPVPSGGGGWRGCSCGR